MGKYVILKDKNGGRIVVKKGPNNEEKVRVSMFKVSKGIIVECTPTISSEEFEQIMMNKKGNKNGISSYDIADYYFSQIDLNNAQRISQGKSESNIIIYNLIGITGLEDDRTLVELIELRKAPANELEIYATSRKFYLKDKMTNMENKYMACAMIVFTIITAIVVSNLKFGFQEFIKMIETYPKITALISMIGTASICELVKLPEKMRKIGNEMEIETDRAYEYYELAKECNNANQQTITKTEQNNQTSITEIECGKTAYETPTLTIEDHMQSEQAAQTRRDGIVMTTTKKNPSQIIYLQAIKETLREMAIEEREYEDIANNFWGGQSIQSDPQIPVSDKEFMHNVPTPQQNHHSLTKKIKQTNHPRTIEYKSRT